MEFNSHVNKLHATLVEECDKTRDTAANGIRKTEIRVINESASHCPFQLTLSLILLCHLLPERWITQLHTAINSLSFIKSSILLMYMSCSSHRSSLILNVAFIINLPVLWMWPFICITPHLPYLVFKFKDNPQQFYGILARRSYTEKWKWSSVFKVSIF